jgi:hypothetical protein
MCQFEIDELTVVLLQTISDIVSVTYVCRTIKGKVVPVLN